MIDFIDLLDNDHIYGKINLYRVLDNLRDFPYDIAYDFDIETAEKYLNWLKENKIVDYLEGLKLAEEMIKTSNIEQYEAIFVYPAERISIYHWRFLKALRPKYLYLLGSLKNDVIGLTNSWANEIDIITEAFNSFKSLTESHVEIEDIKEISSLKPDIIVVNTLKDALELSEKLKEINCHHSIIFKNILTPKLNAVWKAFLAITRENSTLEEVLPFLNYLPSKILPFKKEKFLSAIKTNPINKAKISLYPIIHKTILNLFKNNDLPTIFKLINWGPEDKKIWSLIRTAPHLWYEPSLTITTATRLSTRIDDFVSKSLNLGNYLVNKFPIVNNTLNIVYIVNFVEKNEEEKRVNRSNY